MKKKNKDYLLSEIKHVLNEVKVVNFDGHKFMLRTSVNEDPKKQGIRVQFLPTTFGDLTPTQRNDVSIALGEKLDNALEPYELRVERDRNLKDKTIIGFFIYLEYIDKIIRQALSGEESEEAGEEESTVNERKASIVGKEDEPDYKEVMELLELAEKFINTELEQYKKGSNPVEMYWDDDMVRFEQRGGNIANGYDKSASRKRGIFPGKSSAIHTLRKANYNPEKTKEEVEKHFKGRIGVEFAKWKDEVTGVNYIFLKEEIEEEYTTVKMKKRPYHTKLFDFLEEDSGQHNMKTVKGFLKALGSATGKRYVSLQMLAKFIYDNYEDITGENLEDSNPEANDHIADIVSTLKVAPEDFAIAWEDATNESGVNEYSNSDARALAYIRSEQDPKKIKDLQNAIGKKFSDNYSSTLTSQLVDVKEKDGKWIAITREAKSDYNDKQPKGGEKEATIGITWNAMFF